ncbi:MAG: cytochrome c [Alphaproteobacteria bacterium]
MIKIIFILTVVLSSFLAQLAYAENTEDVVKYRKNIMKAIGNHISIVAANLKGKVSINEDIVPHSKSILLTLSSINISKTFPVNSGPNSSSNTQSLENIWTEKDLFSNAMKDSVEKAQNLVLAAESGDKKNIAKSLGALGKTCGSCHNKFRKKKN